MHSIVKHFSERELAVALFMNLFELSGLLRTTECGKFQRNPNLIMRILIHS